MDPLQPEQPLKDFISTDDGGDPLSGRLDDGREPHRLMVRQLTIEDRLT